MPGGCLREPLAAGVLPRGRAFPFAVRLTSDVLADDGAAAMTAVSSATLALASAGIPLSAPVAGETRLFPLRKASAYGAFCISL